MSVCFLVTTMGSNPISIVDRMHLKNHSVILADQCGEVKYEELSNGNGKIVHVCSNTKGVSINRNLGLHYTDDIVVFCDDDQILVDDCERLVLDEFEKVPQAVAIKFFCKGLNDERPISFKRPDRLKKASLMTLMSAGVPGLAVKKSFLDKYDIRFSEQIGPGNYIYCGEDSVFLKRMHDLSKGIYLSPILISYIKMKNYMPKSYHQP